MGWKRFCGFAAALGCVSLMAGGCASKGSVEGLSTRMAVNESRVDSLDSRVNTLDERVHEIALKCCGKPQSQCKCSGTCVDAQVHNPGSGGHVDSSGAPCEIQFNGTPFRNRVEGTIYVTLSSRGTNAVGYIHPQTGEDCIVTEGNWKAGDQYPIKIFSEVNGQSTLRISKQP